MKSENEECKPNILCTIFIKIHLIIFQVGKSINTIKTRAQLLVRTLNVINIYRVQQLLKSKACEYHRVKIINILYLANI